MKFGIISDVHEDIVHLKSAFVRMEKLGCDEIICLGDISGFSVPYCKFFDTRNASECLRMIRENCKFILMGNHDLSAIQKLPTIFSPEFIYPESWLSLDYHERSRLSNGKLWLYLNDELNPLYTKADIEFVSSLPEYVVFEHERGNILFSHCAYPNITGSLKRFYTVLKDYTVHFDFMQKQNCKISFTGHMHTPGLFVVKEQKTQQVRFGKKYMLSETTHISIPPIVEGSKNGFCVFDVDEYTATAIRI